MMKENSIKKINKVGKIGYVVSKIMCILSLIGAIATLIGTIACFSLPKNLVNVKLGGNAVVTTDISKFTTFSDNQQKKIKDNLEDAINDQKFSINGSNYSLASYEVDKNGITLDCYAGITNINMRDIAKVCLLVCITCICTYVTCIFIKKLCISFRDCSSPFEETVIKSLQNLAFSLIPWACVSNLSYGIISVILNNNFSLGLNLGIVMVILIILGLSYIFKYGAILQTESDETL